MTINYTLSNIMARDDTMSEVTTVVLLWLFGILTFCIGVFLHVRIIILSKREKELTWKLDITNSSLTIAHFTHTILLNGITYAVEDLHIYTGEWFCYLAKELRYYGGLYVTAHSMVVSILKYMLIIHWKKVRDFGKEKVTNIFFFVNFLHPFCTAAIHLMIRSDFLLVHEPYKEIDLCLGDPKNYWGQSRNGTPAKYHNMCMSIASPDTSSLLSQIMYIFRSGTCWIQIIILYLIGWNFFEMLFYCRIFGFMRR